MQEIFLDVLVDSAKTIPLLILIYVGIELIEYKFGSRIRKNIQKAGPAGPAVGALVGAFPQCGFSVVASALYTQRLATIGTLMAVYLATSDEAIPVLLSQPEKAGVILPLLLSKFVIALVAGYVLDFIFRKKNKETLEHITAYGQGKDEKMHDHSRLAEETGCCGHTPDSSARKFNPKEIFLHPLVHTVKIFFFIFVVSLLINTAIFKIGQEALAGFLSQSIFLQPFLAALIGLIPNCASSVAIAELYLEGIITFGSTVAGLCAGAGLGMLVLFREEKDKKRVFLILGLLFGISVAAGLLIQYVKI